MAFSSSTPTAPAAPLASWIEYSWIFEGRPEAVVPVVPLVDPVELLAEVLHALSAPMAATTMTAAPSLVLSPILRLGVM
jgi:hypothetical protein